MKVLIQGKHLRVPDELKSYVAEKLVAPLTRFYDDSAAELRVEFGDMNGPKGGDDKECHLTLRMPGASAIQIEEATPDCYASLDAAADRLIRVCHRELDRMRQGSSRRKYRPLGTTVAEGGIPGGTVEELPNADELSRVGVGHGHEVRPAGAGAAEEELAADAEDVSEEPEEVRTDMTEVGVGQARE